MSQEDITTRYRVDISELKAGISEANRQIKLANAEFKAAAAGMDDWQKSTDGISKKLEQLKKVLEQEEKKLNSYKEQLNRQKEAYDENGKRADELKKKLQELSDKGVSKTSEEFQKYKDALSKIEQEQESNRTAAEKLEITYLNQQGTVNGLKKDINNYSNTLEDLKKDSENSADATKEMDGAMNEAGNTAEKVANGGFTVLKGALSHLAADGIRKVAKGFKDLISDAIEYETAFTDVRKTVDGTDEELEQLNKDIRNMSKYMPQSASDIAEVAAAAGQLGIKTNNIADFTKTMIMLGDSTNLSSDEAATALAKFANITKMSADDYSKLGSTIVDLGNHFATTEKDIVEMGSRLAAAGSQVGMSQAEIMSLAASLSSVGMEAEAGGTAFSKLLVKMQVATETGNDELESFAKVAGMTADEFSRAFQTNAVGALQAFIVGLDDTERNGMSAIGVLDDMEIREVRLRDSILRATQAKGLFNDAIEMGQTAWKEDTALSTEAERKYDTTASKIQIMKNNFQDLGNTLFEKFQPAIQKAIDLLTELANNEPAIISLTVAITAMIAAFAVSKLISFANGIHNMILATKGLEAVTKSQTVALIAQKTAQVASTVATKAQAAAQWLLNAAMNANPIMLVVAAIGALIAIFAVLWNKSEGFRNFWIGLWENIKNAVQPVVEAIGNWFSEAWENIKNVWNSATEYFENIWEGIKKIFSVVKAVLTGDWEGAWEGIKDIVNSWNQYFSNIWESIKKVFDPVKDWFSEKFKDAWESIKNIWSVVGNWFSEKITTPVSNFFGGLWDNIKKGASDAWTGIKNVFSTVTNWFRDKFTEVWTAVKNVFSTGGKIFDGIKEGILDGLTIVINGIIRGINKVVSVPFEGLNKVLKKLRDFSIGDWYPFGNISTINAPQIPELEYGGILRKGKVGLLEGKGDEAVVPLHKNKYWIKAVASTMAKELGYKNDNVSNSKVTNTVVNNHYTQNNYSPKPLSRREIYRQGKNLLKLMKQEG